VRHALLAVVALPGVVALAVPLLIVSVSGRPFVDVVGVFLWLFGGCLVAWCVREFHVVGRGTLAPWAPPRRLVVTGPYRLSRNPMYVGVGLVLAGWAVAFRSAGLSTYATVVVLAFHVRVVFGEEPWLARTHGAEWEDYRRRVPRWWRWRRGIPVRR